MKSSSISSSFLGLKAELERSKASAAKNDGDHRQDTAFASASSSASASCSSSHHKGNAIQHEKGQRKRKSSNDGGDASYSSSSRGTFQSDSRVRSKKLESEFLSHVPSSSDSLNSTRVSRDKRNVRKSHSRALATGSKPNGSSRLSPPLPTSAEETERIRVNLEKKGRLYSQLSQGKYAKVSDSTLAESSIDWARKVNEEQELDVPHQGEEEASNKEGEEDDPIIEYVDEFGRTRSSKLSLVPREHLPVEYGGSASIPQQDTDHFDDAIYGPVTTFPVYKPDLTKRKEGDSAATNHFSPDFEKRHRGAAFFRFSSDQDTRKRQMDQLQDARSKTLTARAGADAQSSSELQVEPIPTSVPIEPSLLLSELSTSSTTESSSNKPPTTGAELRRKRLKERQTHVEQQRLKVLGEEGVLDRRRRIEEKRLASLLPVVPP